MRPIVDATVQRRTGKQRIDSYRNKNSYRNKHRDHVFLEGFRLPAG